MDKVIFQLRQQQPDRAEHRRQVWYDYHRDIQFQCDRRGVNRSGASGYDQRYGPRIGAAVYGYRANARRHVRVDDPIDARSNLDHARVELCR